MVKRVAAGCAAFSGLLILISCSSAPKGPAKGTPAFYWQAARETWVAGDYSKTMEHLDQLLATENEYTARALPWSLTLTGGLVSGYIDVADSYERGARLNRKDPSPFRRQVQLARNVGGKTALHFVEIWDKAAKVAGADVPLAFPMPRGNAAPVPALAKVGGGMMLPPAEVEVAQNAALERGVLLAACNFAGASNDTAKTDQVLRDGKIGKSSFLIAAASFLYDQSQLYTSDRLDDPSKLTAFCDRAQAALKGVPDSKQKKELSGKVEAALKKYRRT